MLKETGTEGRAAMEKRVSDIKSDVKAGRRKITITFIERANVLSDDWNSSRGGFRGFGHLPRICEGMEIWGPYNATGVSATASRDKIFICQPETAAQDAGCAEKKIGRAHV